MYFCNFVIISLWKKVWPFNVDKLKFTSPKDAFLNFFNVFLLSGYYFPLEINFELHLNKLKFPSPTDTLCQVWLKLSHWFWRR